MLIVKDSKTDSTREILLILFGLPGCGKNFVGTILKEKFGYHFYDADKDLPEVMKCAIVRGEKITDSMRETFSAILERKIRKLSMMNKRLVVAQALPKEKYRQKIRFYFPDAKFILINCPREIIESRLANRTDHIVSLTYARTVFCYFETPSIQYHIVNNTAGKEEVMKQLIVVHQNIAAG